RDEPLIPRELRFEVSERIGSKGEIVTTLDLPALERLAGRLLGLGIEAVAIFFMNSYANPAHEEKAADLLRSLMSGVYVTSSTELTREWYEYERTSTVAGQCLCGAAGDQLYPPARNRPADQRLRRVAVLNVFPSLKGP
ncbi:MAG TPA: hydantoinase/oxoprolinase N-terminal domain-containing protein, partial [Xanthobacteraceae bacterium]|nr:hydantoinase/oxoprolinase N-terminal domain-containing protein [Xanthobacteraceae bacterium]